MRPSLFLSYSWSRLSRYLPRYLPNYLRRYLPSARLLRHKASVILAFLVLTVLLSFITHLSLQRRTSPGDWVQSVQADRGHPCVDNLEWISSQDIAFPVNYARRHIRINPVQGLPRKSVSRYPETLFPAFQQIDHSTNSQANLQHCMDPLTLNVPAFSKAPVDASHVMFGISTTLNRLDHSLPSLSRWLPHTRARLLVMILDTEQGGGSGEATIKSSSRKSQFEKKMRDLGMDVTLVEPLSLKDTYSQRYFSLVKIMYERRNEHTGWISVIDSDTFFPSMAALVKMLAKYSPDENHYIGGISEDWPSLARLGLVGFEGAGIFLSRAMVATIYDKYDLCKEHTHTSSGAVMIVQCIYAVSFTKLTINRDLHQVDLWNDTSGLFENGRQLLSLYNWRPGVRSREGVDLPTAHLVSEVCRECFLQRWWFGEDVILANGYSISFYPKGDLQNIDFNFMEMTWAPPIEIRWTYHGSYDLGVEPTRSALRLDDQKIQFRLIASSVVDGGVRQAYLHPGVSGELDSVLELFWSDEGVDG